MGRRMVELRPQSAKAAMNLGIVLKRSGDLAEAERQLRSIPFSLPVFSIVVTSTEHFLNVRPKEDSLQLVTH